MRKVKTEYMREFVHTAKTLALRESARELFLSPAALSAHIKSIESELGAELFKQSPNGGLALTKLGMIFLGKVEGVLHSYDMMMEECSRIIERDAHSVKFVVQRLLFPCELSILKTIADPRFKVVQRYGDPLYELTQGDADAVLVGECFDVEQLEAAARQNGLDYEVLGEISYGLTASSTSALSKLPSLGSSDLKGHELCVTTAPRNFDRWKKSVERLTGLDLSAVPFNPLYAWDEGTLSMALADDTSVALMPTHWIQQRLNPEEIVYWEQLDGRPLRMPDILLWRNDPARPDAQKFAQAFIARRKERERRD